jgi:hypothetical protein
MAESRELGSGIASYHHPHKKAYSHVGTAGTIARWFNSHDLLPSDRIDLDTSAARSQARLY